MSILLFYISLFLVFVLPGYFLLRVILGKKYFGLLSLEKFLLTFVLSLASTDFLMLALNYFHIPLVRQNLFLALILWSISWFILWHFQNKKITSDQEIPKNIFSNRQNIIFILLFALAVFLRAIYIGDGIIPKSTDLGHHMYWANYIVTNHTLPVYDEKFIIGEHLPFAAISILSKIFVVSSMPTITLFLFNIITLLAVFLLTYFLAKNILPLFNFLDKKTSPYNIALWGLLTIGIFYPLTAPQAKFVSGGVIGNVIGNLLIIVTIYSFLKTIQNKSRQMATIFFITLFTIIYTHHLSTLILAYSLISILLGFIVFTLLFTKFNFRKFFVYFWQHFKLFINWQTISILIIGAISLFILRTPSYLNPKAIDTAVGTPTKITRVGISLPGIIDRIGAWRVLMAGIFSGFILLFLTRFITQKQLVKKIIPPAVSLAILIAWAKIIFLMSWKPAWLKIDIPSGRIITYLTYPLAIMSAFGIGLLFSSVRDKFNKNFLAFLFVFFLGIGFVSGLAQDIAENFRSAKDISKEVMQTYLGSVYLAKNSQPSEQILKDHIYLAGDTWMKIFFMRGYKYPLSRTYARRYEDKYNKHETCTRDMIAKPNSEIGKKCFQETGVKYIFLKPGYDDDLFLRSDNFQEVYRSDSVVIFRLTTPSQR